MLKFIITAFLSSAVLTQAHAESFETVPTAIFKNAQGVPKTVKSLYPDDTPKGFLVMFWAGWCVPCKEELALVARHPEQLQQWNTVAINVDDSGGIVRANGILKSLGWSSGSLYDESGTLFFQINSSGELPLALAFDPQGHLLRILHELKEPELEQLSKVEFQTSTQKGWDISEEFHFIQRDRPNGKSDVAANWLQGRYSTNNWQVAISQNLIRQKRDPTKNWTRFEDDLGPSYVQWQDSSQSLTRARLGDEQIEWGKGALISARAIPGSDVNASLQGVHWSQSVGTFNYGVVAGRVRQQLFGLLLDPTLDLTQEVPLETAYGFNASKQFKFDATTAKIAGGALAYHRDDLAAVSTSYLTPYRDQRAHLNVAIAQDTWGLDVAHTKYWIGESQNPALKASDSSQVDAFVRTAETAKYQIGATFVEHRDSLPRTFTPVLTEYPALPLTNDGVRAWRLSPRATLGPWMIEPQWIREESNHPNDYEKQNSYVLQLLRPDREFKTILLYQKHGADPLNIDAEQRAGVVGFMFSRSLSTQIEYKDYRAVGRHGNTASDQKGRVFATQLSLKLERALHAPKIGQLMLSITRTQQDGYYLATSGIDDRELLGYRVTWTRGPFELRVAACQEPGGLICSGGVCAQRPPLDGFAVESKMHWNF